MSKATESSVEDISFMYMSEVSIQIQQKFDSITKLRLNQVKGIIQYNQPENVTYGEEMIGALRLGAVVRNFTYLGLYSDDGEEEHILGDRLIIAHYDEMLDKLKAAGQALGMATNDEGEKYLVLACQAAYPLSEGSVSTALIASVSMEYLRDALF